MDLNNLADLVFFQNGMMEPWFESKGLGDAGQVLAYFAVSKLGEPPIDGKTDTNPEGLTAAYGKWASAVAARLQAGGLSCKVNDILIVSCMFGLVYMFKTSLDGKTRFAVKTIELVFINLAFAIQLHTA